MTWEELTETIERAMDDAALAEDLVRDPRFRSALQTDRERTLAQFVRDRTPIDHATTIASTSPSSARPSAASHVRSGASSDAARTA